MCGEEGGQVPRDGRIGFVRQPDFLEAAIDAGGRACRRMRMRERSRRRAIGRTSSRVEIDRHRAADELAAAAEDGERVLLGRIVREQRFLRRAARVPERHRLPRIELDALSSRTARRRGRPARDPCCRRRRACGCPPPCRRSTSSPFSSATPTSVKSVVPPPTSHTSSVLSDLEHLAAIARPIAASQA